MTNLNYLLEENVLVGMHGETKYDSYDSNVNNLRGGFDGQTLVLLG